MLLNSFPVTDLRPEVKLMHLLRMRSLTLLSCLKQTALDIYSEYASTLFC